MRTATPGKTSPTGRRLAGTPSPSSASPPKKYFTFWDALAVRHPHHLALFHLHAQIAEPARLSRSSSAVALVSLCPSTTTSHGFPVAIVREWHSSPPPSPALASAVPHPSSPHPRCHPRPSPSPSCPSCPFARTEQATRGAVRPRPAHATAAVQHDRRRRPRLPHARGAGGLYAVVRNFCAHAPLCVCTLPLSISTLTLEELGDVMPSCVITFWKRRVVRTPLDVRRPHPSPHSPTHAHT